MTSTDMAPMRRTITNPKLGELTVDEARYQLIQIINEMAEQWNGHPSEVKLFGACSYFADQQPNCLIGHWLHRYWGVQAEMLTGPANSFGWGYLWKELMPGLNPRVAAYLRRVQLEQDGKTPWLEATAKALTQLLEYEADCAKRGSVPVHERTNPTLV